MVSRQDLGVIAVDKRHPKGADTTSLIWFCREDCVRLSKGTQGRRAKLGCPAWSTGQHLMQDGAPTWAPFTKTLRPSSGTSIPPYSAASWSFRYYSRYSDCRCHSR